jgi:DNA polymerase-3 subunit epsilon
VYAIVDIETTGGQPKESKITEVGIVISDGTKVIDKYETLVNPEREIPFFITRLTGIDAKMVANAPKFFEIAKDIIEKTEGMIFVAHNANFDYGHIRREFKDLGFEYKRDTVCTVQLARKVIPDQPSYSLGKLCKALGIENGNHHRALNDAEATTELLHLCLSKDTGDLDSIRQTNILHERLKVDEIPNKTGIYYFLNSDKEVIYIGKSKNIRQRVKTHLANYKTKKGQSIIEQIAEVDYEILGSELVSLLKESDEIKKFNPLYNRQQRRKLYSWGVYAYMAQDGFYRIGISKSEMPNASFIKGYKSKQSAQNDLFLLVEKFVLCQKLCGLYNGKDNEPCFHHSLKQCKGACCGKEGPNEYNERVQQLIDDQEIPDKSFYIIDRGRNYEEKSCIKIENGQYVGFGFFDNSVNYSDLSELDDFIDHYEDNRDVRTIIKSFIHQKKVKKIIPLE